MQVVPPPFKVLVIRRMEVRSVPPRDVCSRETVSQTRDVQLYVTRERGGNGRMENGVLHSW